MSGLLGYLEDNPHITDAMQGLGHVVRGTGMPAAHLPLPRHPAGEETQVKLRRKRSKVPKPLRYAAGAVAIAALATAGSGRSADAREEILKWMRGR